MLSFSDRLEFVETICMTELDSADTLPLEPIVMKLFMAVT